MLELLDLLPGRKRGGIYAEFHDDPNVGGWFNSICSLESSPRLSFLSLFFLFFGGRGVAHLIFRWLWLRYYLSIKSRT